jgi:GMP reductase
MFSCVKECVQATHRRVLSQRFANYKVKQDYPDYDAPDPTLIPIIADGGARENGDIAKSIVAGATLTMIGGMVAACTDAPGESVYDGLVSTNPSVPMPPIARKKFHGSASSRQKQEHKHVEGIELEIPCNGMTIAELYQDIRESLQSAVSYAGAPSLGGLKDGQYVEVK